MKYGLKTYQPMFEMIRLIFCRMPLQNSVMLKLKIEIISNFSFIIGQKNIQYTNSNIPKISSTKMHSAWPSRTKITIHRFHQYSQCFDYSIGPVEAEMRVL